MRRSLSNCPRVAHAARFMQICSQILQDKMIPSQKGGPGAAATAPWLGKPRTSPPRWCASDTKSLHPVLRGAHAKVGPAGQAAGRCPFCCPTLVRRAGSHNYIVVVGVRCRLLGGRSALLPTLDRSCNLSA